MSMEKFAEVAREDVMRIQRWICSNATVAATPAGQRLIAALLQARLALEMMQVGRTE